jgi:hypothetical protein
LLTWIIVAPFFRYVLNLTCNSSARQFPGTFTLPPSSNLLPSVYDKTCHITVETVSLVLDFSGQSVEVTRLKSLGKTCSWSFQNAKFLVT